MFHKILVCSDGSTCALAAARAAVAFARRNGAEIIVLNVFHFPYTGVGEMGVWAVAIDQVELDRCAREEKEAVKRSICASFAELDTPHRIIQEIGHPVEAILRVAEREEADLIVVGSRGLRGVKELFLGSVSSAVMHHARCPVLIVRGGHVPTGAAAFQEIVLASDGSERAQKATQVAVDMAKKFATSLTVLNVSVDLSSLMLPGEEEAVKREEAIFNQSIPDLYASRVLGLVRRKVGEVAKEAGVYCSYVQKRGHPYEVIVRFAEEHGSDLVVVGSRGLGGFEQMLVGSVSNYVAHHASCPVLIVR